MITVSFLRSEFHMYAQVEVCYVGSQDPLRNRFRNFAESSEEGTQKSLNNFQTSQKSSEV